MKMSFPDMMAAGLGMDELILDADHTENLTKFRSVMESVEHVEVSDLKKSLNTVNSACEEVLKSQKLKEIIVKILVLANTLNEGTVRASVVAFKLDSFLELTNRRVHNNKMTLVHYLCKVLVLKAPSLLNIHEDLISLEAASKIQLKSLAEEVQATIKGLEKAKQELSASQNDDHALKTFHKTLKEFVSIAETEVSSLTNLYTIMERNTNALATYFGEDPAQCPFERIIATLLEFVMKLRKVHEKICREAELQKKAPVNGIELEKKKAQEEAEMKKAQGRDMRNIGCLDGLLSCFKSLITCLKGL